MPRGLFSAVKQGSKERFAKASRTHSSSEENAASVTLPVSPPPARFLLAAARFLLATVLFPKWLQSLLGMRVYRAQGNVGARNGSGADRLKYASGTWLR